MDTEKILKKAKGKLSKEKSPMLQMRKELIEFVERAKKNKYCNTDIVDCILVNWAFEWKDNALKEQAKEIFKKIGKLRKTMFNAYTDDISWNKLQDLRKKYNIFD